MPVPSPPSTRTLVSRSLLAGVAAGLRSMTPLGVLARQRNDVPTGTGWTRWPVIRSGIGRTTLQLAWVGELIGDKLPMTPPRTNPGSLAGRTIVGAIAGLAVASGERGGAPKLVGVLSGGVGSLAGSYGGYLGRTVLTERIHLPDLPGALLEDALAIVLARHAIAESGVTRHRHR